MKQTQPAGEHTSQGSLEAAICEMFVAFRRDEMNVNGFKWHASLL